MKGKYRRLNYEELQDKWVLYRRILAEPTERKLEFTRLIIARSIQAAPRRALLYSGGKDSTILLNILKDADPDIVVIHNNTTLGNQDLLDFIRAQTKGMQYIETTAADPVAMWQATGYWPILSKRGFSQYKRRIPDLKTSPVNCCYQLKEKYSYQICKTKGIGLIYWGNRASESYRRRLAFLDNGFLFQPKRYPWMHSYPLQHWNDEDISEYLEKIGYPPQLTLEAGCRPCATDLTFYPNNLSRLYSQDRDLWRYYMEAGMAEQILKINNVTENVQKVIESKPGLLLKVQKIRGARIDFRGTISN